MAKYILLVIFLLCNLNSNAQLLVRDGNCYVYGIEKICDSKSLEHILSTNTDALMWYHKSKSSAKKADIFGYTAIGGLVVGGLLVAKGANTDGDDPNYAPLAFGLLMGLTSCVFGTVGIVQSVKHVRESKKVVHVFNGVSYGYENPEEEMIITYGIVGNGLGVRLSF